MLFMNPSGDRNRITDRSKSSANEDFIGNGKYNRVSVPEHLSDRLSSNLQKCICFWHRLSIKSENCPLAINVSVFHLNLLRKLTKHKIQNTPILLSPAPDQFVIPLAPARRIRRREKLILSLQGYRTFMNEPVFS